MDNAELTNAPVVAAARGWHPALVWFLLYCAASGAVEGMLANRPEADMLLLAVQVAVSGFLIFWWASDDAGKRGRPLSRWSPAGIVLFGAFWIVYRLFTTRERAEAWRGLRRGALVMAGSLALYLAFFTSFAPAATTG